MKQSTLRSPLPFFTRPFSKSLAFHQCGKNDGAFHVDSPQNTFLPKMNGFSIDRHIFFRLHPGRFSIEDELCVR